MPHPRPHRIFGHHRPPPPPPPPPKRELPLPEPVSRELVSDFRDPYAVMTDEILPELLDKFLVASRDYGEAFRELGERGQYSDMHRKMAKLKRAIWEGEPLERETPEQIVGDLFGHVLILSYLLRRKPSGSVEPPGGWGPGR